MHRRISPPLHPCNHSLVNENISRVVKSIQLLYCPYSGALLPGVALSVSSSSLGVQPHLMQTSVCSQIYATGRWVVGGGGVGLEHQPIILLIVTALK